jgi:hypothetical protein
MTKSRFLIFPVKNFFFSIDTQLDITHFRYTKGGYREVARKGARALGREEGHKWGNSSNQSATIAISLILLNHSNTSGIVIIHDFRNLKSQLG